MQLPITIGLRRSRFLDVSILLSVTLASAAQLAISFPTVVKGLVLVALWVMAAWSWYRLTPVISRLHLAEVGKISIARAGDERFFNADLLPHGVVHHWLTVVRLSVEDGNTCTLIATVDNVDVDDFRRLRLFLRWQADISDRSADV